MAVNEKTIKILPDGKKIKYLPGTTLLETLMHQGVFLRSDCGGNGRCAKCMVLEKDEHDGFIEKKACRYEPTEDISIKIPEQSLLSSHVLSKAPLSFPESFLKRMEAGKTEAQGLLGAAVDLGTTTVAVYIVSLDSGEVKASIAVKNPQSIYGDDVISRINAVADNDENLLKLQQLVVNSISWGIEKSLKHLKKDDVAIAKMVVVGNPTMIHILAGVSPKSIGFAPFQPAMHEAKQFSSKVIGFKGEEFTIQTLPNISGFIGGDILTASIACELEAQEEGTLLIDLGTNGELMLKGRDVIYATSCATGPAFEGAQLSCGMQATPGAVNAIEIGEDRSVSFVSVIGASDEPGLKPSGICGTGVINAVSQFLEKGVIRPDGRFESDMSEFFIARANGSVDGVKDAMDVFISQKDIRSVQLGKAALITGIEFLLKNAGIEKPGKIFLAGAFGSHLGKTEMVDLGMIPDIDIELIETTGNSAGAGAVMALCDDFYIDQSIGSARKVKTIELASNPEFQKSFVRNLKFPDQG